MSINDKQGILQLVSKDIKELKASFEMSDKKICDNGERNKQAKRDMLMNLKRRTPF